MIMGLKGKAKPTELAVGQHAAQTKGLGDKTGVSLPSFPGVRSFTCKECTEDRD